MNNSYISSRRNPCPSPHINVGATILGRLGTVIFLGLAMLTLAGCGDAGKALSNIFVDPPDDKKTYGAFAVGARQDKVLVWVASQGKTFDEAMSKALADCRARGFSRCVSPSAFSQCGSLAAGTLHTKTSATFIVRYASGPTIAKAQEEAISICVDEGADFCRPFENLSSGKIASFCVDDE